MPIQRANTTQKRLRILGDDEIEAIYGRPRLMPDERGQYFSLSQPERDLLQELRSTKYKVYFVFQLGYFKSKHQFFVFDLSKVEEDVQYILGQHFDNRYLSDFRSIDKDTRLKQQYLILELYNYRLCHAEQRRQLKLRAQQAATISAKPVYIFRDLMTHLTDQRIVAPGYSWMQDTIGSALTFEQNRLTSLINTALETSDIEHLTQLLEDSPGLYEVTQLKREPRDFSAGEIKREIRRGEHIQDLYQVAKDLLPNLGISNESIKYYASLVTYYSVYKLKRLDASLVYLYLLCFICHRYQRLHDNLLGSLIHHVRQYGDAANEVAKERVYQHRMEGNENLDKAGQLLKLFTDDTIAQQTPFHRVRARAFSILERDQIDFVADHITTEVKFDETAFRWEHIDDLAQQFKLNLRPILMPVDWAASSGQTSLIEAIDFLKDAFGKGRSLGQYALDKPRQYIRSMYGPLSRLDFSRIETFNPFKNNV